ncbi:hypothetical protein Bealeia2_02038 (plasmid) [Candidatus Bealeia paramacronuclearis]|nr:hypothetical protein [Candidatus Bealeia paramacronuclearis]
MLWLPSCRNRLVRAVELLPKSWHIQAHNSQAPVTKYTGRSAINARECCIFWLPISANRQDLPTLGEQMSRYRVLRWIARHHSGLPQSSKDNGFPDR